MTYYVHTVPGRLRIKIPQLKQRLHHARRLELLLSGLDGVEGTRVNTLTGSFTVYYDPKAVDSPKILRILRTHGYFDEKAAVIDDGRPRTAKEKVGAFVGRALFGWAVGKALEPTGLSFLSAFI